ncbi:antibiotic biosynthesis monooxygenase [Devosia yakushimensis]|uniref:Antibiotic biosynthesis monooxygenase n=1 Tax=Devosia yakushimensis TaxID=470028 RepID=A0ABQ5UBX4_9HYPH|nr:putative quinol monooxygenase [Devosia yakushimensis]GLQ08817.1 antibiotic biosynthesis monooxygenase [Devosia yakushimensis]
MIYVVATLRIRPESLEAMAEAAIPAIAATRREPGCRFYDMHASITDPERVTFIERWSTRAALEAHFASTHVAAFLAASQRHVVASTIEIIHPERVESL